ncbi:MAG: hypothetical protein ACOVNP_07640 [Flavobacterium sp.]
MENETSIKNETVQLGIPVVGSSLFISADDENLKKVREKYGKTHSIEAVKGTKVIMEKLAKNQSVCWGDGESYHFRLTAL